MSKQVTLKQVTRKTLLQRFIKVTKRRFSHSGESPSSALLESFMCVDKTTLNALLQDLGLAELDIDFQLSVITPEWTFAEMFDYFCQRIREHRCELIRETVMQHLAEVLRCDASLVESNSTESLSDCGESSVVELLNKLEQLGIAIDPEVVGRVNDTSTTIAEIIDIATGFDDESQNATANT